MIHQIFPTTVYQKRLDTQFLALQKELKNEAFIFSRIDKVGIQWCKENQYLGYTSYSSIPEIHLHSPTFQELEKVISRHVRSYSKSLQLNLLGRSLVIDTMWVNIMPKNAYHTSHLHPLSVISGTYYVDTPKDSSQIRFEDPRLVNFMARPPQNLSKTKTMSNKKNFGQSPYHFNIQPESHEVILFESWLRHEVVQNKSKEKRISISFNYRWDDPK